MTPAAIETLAPIHPNRIPIDDLPEPAESEMNRVPLAASWMDGTS